MLGFILGVILTLVLVGLFVKVQANIFLTALREAKVIQNDLENLYQQYIKTSGDMLNDLEEKINEGKEVLAALERISFVNPHGGNFSTAKKGRTKNEKKSYEIKLSAQQQTMLNLAQEGYSIKDISQKLGVGQDQVAMVLELYKNKI